jgi:dienelactone hydrolase
VLGQYGGKYRGIPVETVEKMCVALKGAGNASELIVYPDVPHGFNADYRPSNREQEAARLVQAARHRLSPRTPRAIRWRVLVA